MIVFETMKKYMQRFGYLDVQSPFWFKNLPIRTIQLIKVIILSTAWILTSFWLAFFVANTDYNVLIRTTPALVEFIYVLITYVIFTWKRFEFNQLIIDMEQLIGQSSRKKFILFD